MKTDPGLPQEGALYKDLTVAGHKFELRYGYYEECERQMCPPVVIFPDLMAQPLFSEEGYPLVTQVQDACPYYRANQGTEDHWCGDCIYYSGAHREIGICRCAQRRNSK